MSLSDFANVVVSQEGPALTQVGFGTIMCAAFHDFWPEVSRSFTSLSQLVDEDVDPTHRVYLMVQRAFAQNPRPSLVKVGKCANAPQQSTRITPIAADLTVYRITIYGEDLDEELIEITSGSGATVDQICDALQTAIGVAYAGGVTVTPSGATATYLDITPAADKMLFFADWNHELLVLEDLTPDPGIAEDLDAIRLADADWYGLAIDNNSALEIEEAADWAETQDVIFAWNNSDTGDADADDDTNIGTTLAAKSYMRSPGWFDNDDTGAYSGLGALAERFPFDPGGANAGGIFHGRTIRGVTADLLSPTRKGVLIGADRRFNVYITTAGRAHTLKGWSPSGEFIDVVRFLDWFRIRLQERIATLILDNHRIPYTDKGISLVKAACLAQIQSGLRAGGIAPTDSEGNPPLVTVPTLAETDQADRAARVLRNVQCSFRLAGAIQLVDPINVFVSF